MVYIPNIVNNVYYFSVIYSNVTCKLCSYFADP